MWVNAVLSIDSNTAVIPLDSPQFSLLNLTSDLSVERFDMLYAKSTADAKHTVEAKPFNTYKLLVYRFCLLRQAEAFDFSSFLLVSLRLFPGRVCLWPKESRI